MVVDPDGVELPTIRGLVDLVGLDILEVGCGEGRMTFGCAEEARSVLAFDADEELVEAVKTLRRHVAERFDDAAEALEEADSWEHLRLPAAVRRRLRQTDETPVEFIDTIRYRLLRNASS